MIIAISSSAGDSGEQTELLGGLEEPAKRRSPERDYNVTQHIKRRTFPCTTAQVDRKFLYFNDCSVLHMQLDGLSLFLRDFKLPHTYVDDVKHSRRIV